MGDRLVGLCKWEFAPGIRCTLSDGHEHRKHLIAVDKPLSEFPEAAVGAAMHKLAPRTQLGALAGGLLGGLVASLSSKPQPCAAHRLNNCTACKNRKQGG